MATLGLRGPETAVIVSVIAEYRTVVVAYCIICRLHDQQVK